jgi:hypothetical protein
MTDNIVMIKNTPVAGRRPTGGRQGELYFNFADRVIGCMDGAGMPVDIASAIPVGEEAPAGPVPGQLWLNTSVTPAVLQVFMGAEAPEPWIPVTASFVVATEEQALEGDNNEVGMTPLRVRQAIEAMSSSVSVGDTAPADPRPGELWFRTAAPVGLFIWYQDADSSQWVQVGGGGGAEFATVAEARAGTVVDKVMSPALVRALSGIQGIEGAGQQFLTFDEIPFEAGDIDLTLNGIVYPANAVVYLDFSGAPNARAWSTRILFAGAYSAPVGDDENTRYVLDTATSNQGLSGLVRLSRDVRGGSWGVTGTLRRSATSMLTYGGVFNMRGGSDGRLRLNSTIAFTQGRATVRWRI